MQQIMRVWRVQRCCGFCVGGLELECPPAFAFATLREFQLRGYLLRAFLLCLVALVRLLVLLA